VPALVPTELPRSFVDAKGTKLEKRVEYLQASGSTAIIFTYMRKVQGILCLAALVLAATTGWRYGVCILANIELRDDMQDILSLPRIGLTEARSDEGFRQLVLQHAKKYGIELNPEQITVRRSGPDDKELYLAADYTRLIHVPGMTFTLHFDPHVGTK
jgi:hypothetical protein